MSSSQTMSSPATKTFACDTEIRGTAFANSSASSNSCSLRPTASKLLLRSSAAISAKEAKFAAFLGPFRHFFPRSASRCGTCSNSEPPEPEAAEARSTACTMALWSSRAASCAAGKALCAAISSIARETRRHFAKRTFKSSRSGPVSLSWQRCVWARNRTSAFRTSVAPLAAFTRNSCARALIASASSFDRNGVTAVDSPLERSRACKARASVDALSPLARASIVSLSTPLGATSLSLPFRHHISDSGTPRMNPKTKMTSTIPCWSLLMLGIAMPISTRVGPSGLPYSL
mmetsp:Transcript_75546/g.190000  ORF Transcript_75546/g.190000 Transcript_75546/m.190000 type:complete len:289 (+) Transcript_75546:539-1405(+)